MIKERMNKNKLYFSYTILLLFFEVLLSVSCFSSVNSWFFIILSSICLGMILTVFTSYCKGIFHTIITCVIVLFLTFSYGSQIIYYKIFGTFYNLAMFVLAGDAMEYNDITLKVIKENWGIVVLLVIPLLLTIFYLCKQKDRKTQSMKYRKRILLFSIILYVGTIGCMKSNILFQENLRKSFNRDFVPTVAMEQFGSVFSLQCNMNQLAGWVEEVPIVIEPIIKEEPIDPVYDKQILDLDFDKLLEEAPNDKIKSLHSYFKNKGPQVQNDYTGMFKGKNLIMLTAESFCPYAIDKEVTPTLYKLYNEGFQFTNFYTPGWPVSTSDGEYVTLQSLYPTSGENSFITSSSNSLPFTMARLAGNAGYGPLNAYHAHTHTYYSRYLSHPNLGYTFKAKGMGLNMTDQWPESDLEMMELSVDEYIKSDKPFHAYYMTVSGHQLYTFAGNSMAYKNKDAVNHLPYSEAIQAYLACHIELDKSLEYIITRLKEEGKYEDTVICLSADHYPYGLTLEQLEERSNKELDDDFSKYENSFLVWSGSMKEPVVIDKLGSSIDILPTVANLMGFEYDSRLYMGHDLLSNDYDPLVIFSNRSFISDKGFYNSRTKEFKSTDDSVDDSYVSSTLETIDQQIQVSKFVLLNDYYSYLK